MKKLLLVTLMVCVIGTFAACRSENPIMETENSYATETTEESVVENDVEEIPEETLQVNNVQELLEAIAPGATIVLSPGYYNLSEYTEEIWATEGEEWNQNHQYVKLRECFDGGVEVVVQNVDDIFIIGDLESDTVTELVVETRYGAVLNFEDCNNVSLNGLTMGHTQAGACDESVITFSNSMDISLSAMDLYGCGMYGFTAKDESGNIYIQNCTIRDCEAGPFYITEPVGKYEFRNCWLNGSFGGGYYEPSEEAELIFAECNFGQNETNYWHFNQDAVFENCYWDEITEYYPGITLHLSEDGTGYYESEDEYYDITWSCETDGTLTLEYEIYRYADVYVDHQDGFDMLWIMVQMDEEVIWFY